MDRKGYIVLGTLFVITWSLVKLISLHALEMRAFSFIAIFGVMWIPGIFALVVNKYEKLHIPFFGELNGNTLVAFLTAYLIGVFTSYNPNNNYTNFLDTQLLFPLLACPLGIFTSWGGIFFWWGYLYKKLSHLHPLIVILIVGVTWSLWHAPFILLCDWMYYTTYPVKGLASASLAIILLSPVLFYFRWQGNNVFNPALFLWVLFGVLGSSYDDGEIEERIIGAKGIIVMSVCACISLALLWKQGAFKKTQLTSANGKK